jgi:hypothetical protein
LSAVIMLRPNTSHCALAWPGLWWKACDKRCGCVQVQGVGSLRHPSTGNRAELTVCTADDHIDLAPLVRRMTSEVSFGHQRGPPHTLNRVHNTQRDSLIAHHSCFLQSPPTSLGNRACRSITYVQAARANGAYGSRGLTRSLSSL